ncbi:MAG TPA: SdpI family protein [Polyangiales bacterium]|nr:SdpI family protein [Polyangiales bacterium]
MTAQRSRSHHYDVPKTPERFLPWLILALTIAGSAWCYPSLPARLVTHWNAAGQPDGHMAKASGVVVLPLLMCVLGLLLSALPRVSPKALAPDGFTRAYYLMTSAILGLLALVQGLILATGAGIAVDIKRWVPAAMGGLFIVLGNLLSKTKKNFFVGIRTPWTLANDEVWSRTHRFGGKVFVVVGVLLIVVAALRGSIMSVVIGAVLAGLIPAVYSYLQYRRLSKTVS